MWRGVIILLVIPDKTIELCTEVCGRPMILSSEEDVGVFLIFGVIKKICEEYLPWF